ncbi:MAG: sugar phosphate isomerase/epimerase family protein [Thermoguttaceae bacterium]|jgi:sugar phosphate isomerase/epimerase
MNFAICNETFQDWPFDRAFAFAAECGYTGVEIAPFTIARNVTEISAGTRAEIRRQAATAGLEVIGLHWLLAKTEGLHLTSPEPAVRRRTAAYLGELARLAADLGGRVMVFGSPQQRSLPPGVTIERGTNSAAEVFESLVPTLEANHVVLALEPLTTAETDFLTTAAETVSLIERLGSPHIRLHLDCKAMSSESVPIVELIRRHRRLLAHVHANDPNRQGPGFGQLDFVPIFQALAEIGYQDWISVEVFDFAPGIERLARESISYMRRCLAGLRR